MSFVEIGNVNINKNSIDSVELRESETRDWWFVVNVGKHVYRSRIFTTENAAIMAKNEFVATCSISGN